VSAGQPIWQRYQGWRPGDWLPCAGIAGHAFESAINPGLLSAGNFSTVTDRPAEPRTFTRAATIIAAGFLVTLFGGGARFVMGLTLKPIADELGWFRSDLGLATAVYFIVTAIGTFYAG
jgi:hypothetical protein